MHILYIYILYTTSSFNFKKDDPLDKENYRPISLLSHTSKIFENIIFNQINDYIEPYFPDLLTSFRRNHNTQHYF